MTYVPPIDWFRLNPVSADPITRAAAYLGRPYRSHGRTPEGWDCWGCFGYLRAELFGRPVASWAEVYGVRDLKEPARISALIGERLGAWRRVQARAGAGVLMTLYGYPAHVGLMLSQTEFIHVLDGCATAIARVSDLRWKHRIEGFYDD